MTDAHQPSPLRATSSDRPRPSTRATASGEGAARGADPRAKPWVVLKFGGTSVSTRERWEAIRETLSQRLDEGLRPMVVASALSQVSNRLEHILEKAAEGAPVDAELEEIWRDHEKLAEDLGISTDPARPFLDDLTALLHGVRLIHEVTPRLHARVMSAGEMMSTRLGTEYLRVSGLEARWLDAREILEATPVDDPRDPTGRPFLAASCDNSPDRDLQRRLAEEGGAVYVTQGFVASREGETVLLGRGGSDTSGAYFAGLLEAERLEIWTDVPGMFTTNPRKVADARLLRRLPYRVAEELALRGAKVLHPGAIRAAEEAAVPLHVCWTDRPEVEGTVITDSEASAPAVQAVSMRKDMVAFSMRVDTDWQPIGLIADLTSCFRNHGLAIDLLASSPTNLTVALDLSTNHTDDGVLDLLVRELRQLSRPRRIDGLATISLVGTGIRALLHHWGEALRCFEDEEVILLSQAANDRSVSFLVRESAAEGLVEQLHERLFGAGDDDAGFGPTWSELMRETATGVRQPAEVAAH
ncbi:MAG: hypothetical protein DWQ36_01895 [Acidobacteria bacterium]|nr:MAG: hypothetical protein DWQ30_16740 [Acidobacteriota bacterium]REK11522.1 MAG: hypothetical protein DWQ36_01895 [Acidobacteriota bacterium]